MAARIVFVLFAFAAGSATTWWVVSRDAPPGVELASPAGEEGGAPLRSHASGFADAEDLDLQRVLASLQRIEERLDRLERAAERAVAEPERGFEPVEPVEPVDAGDAASEQLAAAILRLENLERALTEEVTRRKASAEPGLAEVKAEHPEEKWAALNDFMADWSRDEKAATDDLRLLSYRDVLTRFGSPTEMWSNERGTHWTYGRGHDAVNGGYQREVYVRFEDGLVTTLGVK